MKYIQLTTQDVASDNYNELSNVAALKSATYAYVQQIDAGKCSVYLKNLKGELTALGAAEKPNYKAFQNDVYLLPYQVKAKGKAGPLYHFSVGYRDKEEFAYWLNTLGLKVYYAEGVGTSFCEV